MSRSWRAGVGLVALLGPPRLLLDRSVGIPGHGALHEDGKEVPLVREHLVDGRNRDTGSCRDVLDACPGEAVRHEHLGGAVEDPLPGPLGLFAAQPLDLGHDLSIVRLS